MPKANWIQLNQNLEGIINAFAERQKQKQEMQQALQMYLLKAQIDAQTKPLDPNNILSQLELANVVKQLQGNGMLNMGQPITQPTPGMGQPMMQQSMTPRQYPTALQASPFVPENLRAKFAQTPISPPSLINRFRQPQQATPQPFIQIQKGIDKYGLPTYETVKNPEYEMLEKTKEADIKQNITQRGAERMTQQSVMLVAGAARRLAETYRDAYKEKGIGSRGRQITSGTALWFGGERAQKYPATAAFTGQKTEMLTKMMPLLTQQGDKPGSVRLVSTIFDKLEKTLPDYNTPPIPARRMIVETIRNMFGFSLAIKRMGITNEMVEGLNPQQLQQVGNQIANFSKSIQLSPDEKRQLDDLLNTVVAPIDELSRPQENQQTNIQGIPRIGQIFQGQKVIGIRRIR